MTTIPSLRLLVEIPSKETQQLEAKLPERVPRHRHHRPSAGGSDPSPDCHVPEGGLDLPRGQDIHRLLRARRSKAAPLQNLSKFSGCLLKGTLSSTCPQQISNSGYLNRALSCLLQTSPCYLCFGKGGGRKRIFYPWTAAQTMAGLKNTYKMG